MIHLLRLTKIMLLKMRFFSLLSNQFAVKLNFMLKIGHIPSNADSSLMPTKNILDHYISCLYFKQSGLNFFIKEISFRNEI